MTINAKISSVDIHLGSSSDTTLNVLDIGQSGIVIQAETKNYTTPDKPDKVQMFLSDAQSFELVQLIMQAHAKRGPMQPVPKDEPAPVPIDYSTPL